ncbi:MAG: hypothetical protein GXP31_17500 [Kiritimatiellaeota bacterium]|nr:hypothetical protein [Kiritimatiellota bacterium]
MKHPRLIGGLLVAATFCRAASEVVWQIGTPDHNYAELAIAGDYEAFPSRYGAGSVVFDVGKSRADRDWPFIQPGPADAWAGRRVHPFRIRFRLDREPCGTFTLRIDLVDVHSRVPPVLVVRVGGRTGRFVPEPGSGDASLKDPRHGRAKRLEAVLPARLFRKGTNEIVIEAVDGSWVLYDAVTLFNVANAAGRGPVVRNLRVRVTPFLVKHDGRLRRVIEAVTECAGLPEQLAWRVRCGDGERETVARNLPLFGSIRQELTVPVSDRPVDAEVSVAAGTSSKSVRLTVRPGRKWKVFVAASAHTDIGYTHVQPECAERHNRNIDTAVELADKFRGFKWNSEVAWIAENYLRDRKPEQKRRFLERTRQGAIGVQALYANMLTGLCSAEALCRLTWFAHRLHRKYAIPFESAMLSDVPTSVWAMPMMLNQAGIRYFAEGCNNTRAVTFTDLYAKSPCWWEGPDGSRVLMMFTPGYAHAQRWGLTSGIDKARRRILGDLRRCEERKDYPYDAVFLYGAVSDNCLLPPNLASVCAEWNKQYAYPKLILCRNAEFFRYIEKNYGDRLPVVRGSGGTYWEDGAASSARETALNRRAHEALANAEKLFAFLHRLDPAVDVPETALQDTWRNCLLYDEHTWGAHCSVSQPESDFTKAQWKVKTQFAHDADRAARSLLHDALSSLALHLQADTASVVVFNPLNWSRTDVVEVDLPGGRRVEDSRGRPAPACRVDGKVVFLARDVPPCGYRVYRLRPGSVPEPAESAHSLQLENRFYRIEVDPKTGAVASVADKQLGRELVDRAAPYGLNQYLYVSGGKGTRIETGHGPAPDLKISTTANARVRCLRLGTVGRRMIIESGAAMTPRLVTEITLWNAVNRIEFVNRITKKLTYDKEAVYFAFPFATANPVVRYEEPLAVVRPDRDLLPGACRDWFTTQHFVEVSSKDAAVVWASPDAPLVCFGEINTGKWKRRLDSMNGHLYAYVMNNYWFTNYLAGQAGDFTFRFAVAGRPGQDAAASARFGWAASNPLTAVRLEPGSGGTLPADSARFVEIMEPNVLLIGAKTVEKGDGLILRLWNLSRTAITAHIRLPLSPVTKAELCTLVEEALRPLDVQDGTVPVPVRAAGVATVRIE